VTAATTPLSDSRCLSEDEILAFAGGQLSSALRDSAHRHLDACEDCQQLLNEAVRALATARSAGQAEHEEVAWSTMFRPGMVVGSRYEIRRFIARGGMGEVYEALDRELQERVALKTVTSTASDDPGAVRRLKAEVQLARRVSHPNVCRIYDFGTHRTSTANTLSFLTMEFVEGETLGVRLRREGALPVAEATSLARALLRGLAAAHAAGVLHRDFKSDNVLLRREGEHVEPLILDFGLARALDSGTGQSSASGRSIVGTFAYMSPEQLRGEPYTTASDVYSFGLVWFEMLTGELPFKARSSPAGTTLERLTKPVPPPSAQNPLVPSELDSLVSACLHRSAADRPQTAAAVLARLDELERLPSPPKRARKPAVALMAAGLTVGASALALLQSSWQTPATPVSEPAAPPVATHAVVPARVVPESQSQPQPASKPVALPPAAASTEPAKPAPSTAPHPTRAAQSRAPRAASSAGPGWENPFAQPSGELGTVLNQPLDSRTPAGNAELPEGRR
jgi:serine/threonine protein kinase